MHSSGLKEGDVVRLKNSSFYFKVIRIEGPLLILRELRDGELIGPELQKTTGDMVYCENVPEYPSGLKEPDPDNPIGKGLKTIHEEVEELNRKLIQAMRIPRGYLEPSLSVVSRSMIEVEREMKQKNKELLDKTLKDMEEEDDE